MSTFKYACKACGKTHGEFWRAKECCAAVPNDIDATLAERGSRYGSFAGHARVTMALKRTLEEHWAARGLPPLADDQVEALHMICHKLGRIVNGDPNYDDSWIDIAGYAKLVADRLRQEQPH